MKRIYEPAAYERPQSCWWDHGQTDAPWPKLDHDTTADIAIIGGGYTGIVAGLMLARAGVDAALLEANHAGFGASGRNGGFCCLGGAKASSAQIIRMVGADGLRDWRQTEIAAVQTVDDLISDLGLDVDRHSQGETLLAHSPAAWQAMQADKTEITATYGLTPHDIPPQALRDHGLAGPFHGAMTLPVGFALHPRKYHTGLTQAATDAGLRAFGNSAVTRIARNGGGWALRTSGGTLRAKRVILATNGYSSDDVPTWLRARYLPVQSSVVVTRPLREDELTTQGWTSAQMAYDSRQLLHYFRLMPDQRFLFGMRGGLSAKPGADMIVRRTMRKDFETMFPAFSGAEQTHFWSGLVCLTARLVPFCGPVTDMPGVFAGFGYHGNGVAMASHTGRLLADLVRGQTPDAAYPALMTQTPRRFPLGKARRLLLKPAYKIAAWRDR
ncbi:MAG: NAD(P)/FAD-dependent oxidoreductase [Primorskyibacter sp.]